MGSDNDALGALTGKPLVIDASSQYVFLGTLVEQDHRYVILENADVHDLRDTNTTREFYVLEAKQHGIHANRKRLLVSRDEIVSLSALDDVLN